MSWIKIFSNDTKEEGIDSNIAAKKSSWSKGKLDKIREVVVFFGDSLIFPRKLIMSNTEWHQFDRYLCIDGESVRVAIVVQALIKESHIGKTLCKEDAGVFVSYLRKGIMMVKEDVGKWVSLIVYPDGDYDLQISSQKGVIQWQEHLT